MKLPEFQQSLQSMNWVDFESFVVDLLRTSGKFKEIRLHQRVMGHEIDIVATEIAHSLGQPATCFFETKASKIVSTDIVDRVAALPHMLRGSVQGPIRTILVASGSFTKSALERASGVGIEVWDSLKLSQIASDSLLQEYFGAEARRPTANSPELAKSKSLAERFQETPSGNASAMPYQRLVSDVLEFLFCPPLEAPRFELTDADARNRRDMIFENACPTGFWAHTRNAYSAHYVVVDAKNYEEQLDKRPVLDIAHYLKPYGCGLFGILVSRQGASEACLHAIREQWIGAQKMIVVVSDEQLLEMLRIKSEAGAPEEIIRASIATFRMSL